MARLNALEFLRACAQKDRTRAGGLSGPAVIYGPQPFLREYVLDAALERMAESGRERLRMQLGPNESPAALLNELSGLGLFAPARTIVCRVLRSRRTRAQGGDQEGDAPTGRDAEARLAEAIAKLPPSIGLVMLYEHERVPAVIVQAVEDCGLAILCARPFPNQLEQYARLFAQQLELELSREACAHLIDRCGGDLGVIHNLFGLAAANLGPKAKVGLKELSGPSSASAPELFELARCVSAARVGRFLVLLERACEVGRDAVEILAVEVIPTLRRMLVAASMLDEGRSRAEIARALGMPAQSPIIQSAIEGAGRLGLGRVRNAYLQAVELDAAFKGGMVREREAALCRLMLNLA
jgi:DNA polymerase III delta subunit